MAPKAAAKLRERPPAESSLPMLDVAEATAFVRESLTLYANLLEETGRVEAKYRVPLSRLGEALGPAFLANASKDTDPTSLGEFVKLIGAFSAIAGGGIDINRLSATQKLALANRVRKMLEGSRPSDPKAE
jgi:hypothetical protein